MTEVLKPDVKRTVTREADKAMDKAMNKAVNKVKAAGRKSSPLVETEKITPADIPADALYVTIERGSARGTGAKDSPLKDIQRAIDLAPDGGTICIAEGNYLGNLDRGWIEIKGKYVSLIGGFNSDFTVRDPEKYTELLPDSNGRLNIIKFKFRKC